MLDGNAKHDLKVEASTGSLPPHPHRGTQAAPERELDDPAAQEGRVIINYSSRPMRLDELFATYSHLRSS